MPLYSRQESYAAEVSSYRVNLHHYFMSAPHDPASLGRYAQLLIVYRRETKNRQPVTGQVASVPTNRFVGSLIAKEAQISYLDNNERWICRNIAFMKNRELWTCSVFHKPGNQEANAVFEKMVSSIRPD